ncbi:MAG TPA: anti-sigma factor, partial [Candidatus Eisenbacteria bacterium]|nr:anti-sigma factor [Candidatus Eisenbacteria bacterium]
EAQLAAEHGELQAARRALAQLQARLADERRWTALVTSPQARRVRLAVTPAGDRALVAYAAYDPGTQRAVVEFEHFAAPGAHDYQLWAIRAGRPVSLGLVRAGADGRAELRLEHVGGAPELGAFAVSLEPAGGSPNPAGPSGPVVMMGKVGD